MDDKTKVLTTNGYEDGPEQVELRETELSMEECKAFRMIAARLNYMAQDKPMAAVSRKGGLQEHCQAKSQ